MQQQDYLIEKYAVAGPRYTSYPTVPCWAGNLSLAAWTTEFGRSFARTNTSEGISLYIHLPFCDSLCTFCACHKQITRKHEVEDPYIDAVLQEWKLYQKLCKQPPRIKELHLGGGTPTFFSPENLKRLLQGILARCEQADSFCYSVEVHPGKTHPAHLETLREFGFSRISIGVQDYDEQVQRAINRVQPFEQVEAVTNLARNLGFTSISHDLVYGLPHQNEKSLSQTIDRTCTLLPDRLAFYGYAHVPWIKGVGQRGFSDSDLPSADLRLALYQLGRDQFQSHGYIDIGMDHFSLPSDSLFRAAQNGTLHRNFMGYTDDKTSLLLGLGMSAISDSWTGFAQNIKTVKEYQSSIQAGVLSVFRGHLLSAVDLLIRRHILNLMCQLRTEISEEDDQLWDTFHCIEQLKPMADDGIVQIEDRAIVIPTVARPFVRNVCMAFDQYLRQQGSNERRFSQTV